VGSELIALVTAGAVAFSVLWANPRRLFNQVFAAMSVWTLCWLGVLWTVTRPGIGNPVPWLRLIFCIGSFFPFFFWGLRQAIIDRNAKKASLLKGLPWLFISVVLSIVVWSDWFIPAESTPAHRMVRAGYYVYFVAEVLSYLVLLITTVMKMRHLRGIALVELKIMLIGGGVTALVCLVVTTVPPLIGGIIPSEYVWLTVFLFYGITALVITSRKIFGAREFLAVMGVRAIGLLVVSGAFVFWLDRTRVIFPSGVSVVLGLLGVLGTMAILERLEKQWGLGALKTQSSQVRSTILQIERDESDLDGMLQRYREILGGWGRTDLVEIVPIGDREVPSEWSAECSPAAWKLLGEERWVTKESLERRKPTFETAELMMFLRARRLAVVVLGSDASGSSRLGLALGDRRDEVPFLWSDVQDLIEWGDLIEVTVSRALLVKRVRETEQIAAAGFFGASIAHEIRNPLVALKAFAEVSPARFDDPMFREQFRKVFGDEVRRIETLAAQLLELSKPREPKIEPTKLEEVVRDAVTLVRPKLEQHGVRIFLSVDASVPSANADRSGMQQILLNLLVNSMHALSDTAGEKRVEVSVQSTDREVVVEVADNGPGVPPALRPRLFLPFNSGKTNGFGLGLAMCARIMRAHGGRIQLVDRDGYGAVFRVTVPRVVMASAVA